MSVIKFSCWTRRTTDSPLGELTACALGQLTVPSVNWLHPRTTDCPLRQLAVTLGQLIAHSDNWLSPSDSWLPALKYSWQHQRKITIFCSNHISGHGNVYRISQLLPEHSITLHQLMTAVTSGMEVILGTEENMYERLRLNI